MVAARNSKSSVWKTCYDKGKWQEFKDRDVRNPCYGTNGVSHSIGEASRVAADRGSWEGEGVLEEATCPPGCQVIMTSVHHQHPFKSYSCGCTHALVYTAARRTPSTLYIKPAWAHQRMQTKEI